MTVNVISGSPSIAPAIVASNPTNAVNGLQVTAAITGVAPSLVPYGTDTDVGLTVIPKGSSTAPSTDYSQALLVVAAPVQAPNLPQGLVVADSSNTTPLAPGGQVSNGFVQAFRPASGAAAGSPWFLLGDSGGNESYTMGVADGAGAYFQDGANLDGVLRVFNVNNALLLGPGSGTSHSSLRVQAAQTGTLANGVLVKGNIAANAPVVGVHGTDTNIDLTLAAKGTGVLNVGYASTALGGGSAATLGTVGGSGPATAAQNSWLKVKVNGTAGFLPLWQ